MSENNSALHDLLTQEEIDALLKVDNKKLSDLIKVSSDRKKCPTFEKNINLFARLLITTIQNLTQTDDISIEFKDITFSLLGNYLDSLDSSSVLGLYSLSNLRQTCLIALNSDISYTLIDMCLGGRRGTAALPVMTRPYTQIEKNILSTFFTNIAPNLNDALKENFIFENLNTTPKTALIASPACEIVIAHIKITVENRTGLLEFVIPSHLIQQMYEEQEVQNTPPDMANALLNVPVELKAVLDKTQIPFSNVLKWKKGDLLPLSYFDEEPIEMMCANQTLFKGSLHVNKKMFFISIDKKKES
ncbi:MAG: flagellar motor switch protein FliM [Alphaproteobacteria bacterium]